VRVQVPYTPLLLETSSMVLFWSAEVKLLREPASFPLYGPKELAELAFLWRFALPLLKAQRLPPLKPELIEALP